MPDEPRLTIVPDYAALSRQAADAVVQTIADQPNPAIAVPTGSTPLGLYDELIRRARAGEVNLCAARYYCLDEYLGVTPDDPASFTGWLLRSFFEPAGIPSDHIHPMPATAPDPAAAAARYDAELAAAGGLDLAVLGLGPNGHIAYNEPGSAADAPTRVVTLTAQSREQASGYWEGAVPIPGQAMTIGVAPLIAARRVLLMVAGAEKAQVLREALRGPMTAAVPASWLRLAGPRLDVIADAAAASDLAAAGG